MKHCFEGGWLAGDWGKKGEARGVEGGGGGEWWVWGRSSGLGWRSGGGGDWGKGYWEKGMGKWYGEMVWGE